MQFIKCAASLDPFTQNDQICGAHGTCLTLAELAPFARDEFEEILPNNTYNSTWDSETIKTCLCARAYATDNQNYDRDGDWNYTYRGPHAFATTGWKGYHCGQAYCPTGDYPRTIDYNEIQRLNCTASNGSMFITFRGHTTDYIPSDSSAEVLQSRLEALPSISSVHILYDTDKYCLFNSLTCNKM